jgi:hypothetical protein
MDVLDEFSKPARQLIARAVGLAEVAVDPLAEFVIRQKELADRMETWAKLQHELADQMIAWAELQRRTAMALDIWLAPAESVAQLTTRALHAMDAETDAQADEQIGGPT